MSVSRRKALKKHRSFRRRMPSNWCQVYILRDPSDYSIKYVGQTRSVPAERWRWHLKAIDRKLAANERLSPVQVWIKSLMQDGSPPMMEIIDPDGIWDISEAVWIERMRVAGHTLFNRLSVVKMRPMTPYERSR